MGTHKVLHSILSLKLGVTPNHVYKLKKALYGLKQAPKAWYERLRDFLLYKGFKMGKVDNTLFTKKLGNDLFVLQIYVDESSLDQPIKTFVKSLQE